jgi:hypothetical protein
VVAQSLQQLLVAVDFTGQALFTCCTKWWTCAANKRAASGTVANGIVAQAPRLTFISPPSLQGHASFYVELI